jgi:LAO/AO transport system kinase
MGEADLGARIAGLLRGERLAVAACLNDVEDQRPAARARACALEAELARSGADGRAHRIGLTGPPGVGKSSLVAALARSWRVEGVDAARRTVAVLAVDPSSARSGGALLGDRVRIAVDVDDEGLFIRSLATRGELGGLAAAVPGQVAVLSAAFDVVIVETVGVGQSETHVHDVVDTLVFVVQPGAGDTLQHLKAGIMEVPDIFVVNKSDTGTLATETRAELHAALASLKRAGVLEGSAKVMTTSARASSGIAELIAAIDAHHASGLESGSLADRRRAGAIARGVRGFARRYGELGVERAGGPDAVREAVARYVGSGEDVASVVARLQPLADGGSKRS